LAGKLDCVEEVVMRHMYRHPICENIIRMNDSLSFEHETRLPNGILLLIIYRYNFKNGLTADKIFDKNEFEDVTKKYENHPNVVGAMQLINEETQRICKQ
jgi:hypothetical protein